MRDTIMQTTQEAVETLHDVIHKAALPDHMKQAIARAFYQKGKDKEQYLTKSAPSPSKDPWAYAAWAGLQPNKYKAASCTGSFMLYMDADMQQFVLDLRKVKWPMGLDKDAAALSGLGLM